MFDFLQWRIDEITLFSRLFKGVNPMNLSLTLYTGWLCAESQLHESLRCTATVGRFNRILLAELHTQDHDISPIEKLSWLKDTICRNSFLLRTYMRMYKLCGIRCRMSNSWNVHCLAPSTDDASHEFTFVLAVPLGLKQVAKGLQTSMPCIQ